MGLSTPECSRYSWSTTEVIGIGRGCEVTKIYATETDMALGPLALAEDISFFLQELARIVVRGSFSSNPRHSLFSCGFPHAGAQISPNRRIYYGVTGLWSNA